MEARRLQREALMVDEPRMLLLFVFSSETQLQKLWLQVQQLVIFLTLSGFYNTTYDFLDLDLYPLLFFHSFVKR